MTRTWYLTLLLSFFPLLLSCNETRSKTSQSSSADLKSSSLRQNVRLFALINMALADAGIKSWFDKYGNATWRPVVAIREADTDGNPATIADPTWSPFGAPASNGGNGGQNFSPNFPAYTSGHATFGAAAFRMLANFYGRDDISFSFVSDEFNGKTTDGEGNVRPKRVRHYESLSQASEENGQSRIYLGIHWAQDKVHGIASGNAVSDAVFATRLKPVY